MEDWRTDDNLIYRISTNHTSLFTNTDETEVSMELYVRFSPLTMVPMNNQFENLQPIVTTGTVPLPPVVTTPLRRPQIYHPGTSLTQFIESQPVKRYKDKIKHQIILIFVYNILLGRNYRLESALCAMRKN